MRFFGILVVVAGVLMMVMAVRAQLRYRRAMRTRRRAAGVVVGTLTQVDDGTTVYAPVVEVEGRTFSPVMYTSRVRLEEGRRVEVLLHPSEPPILDVRPFHTGTMYSPVVLFVVALVFIAFGVVWLA